MKTKIKTKVLTALIASCLVTSGASLLVSAAEVNQDGIKISTSSDKTEYQKGEQPEISVYVTNLNEYEVYNVKVENALPKGFCFIDQDSEEQEIGTLEAGATIEMAFKVEQAETQGEGIIIDEQDQNDLNKTDTMSEEDKSGFSTNDKTDVQTGDSTNVWSYTILAVIAGSIIIGVIIKKRKAKEFLAIILCIGMGSTLLNGVDVLGAENVTQRQLFISTSINYNDEEVEIGTVVHYEIPDKEIAYIDPNVEELVDAAFDKTGSETLTFEYNDECLPVTGVDVSYTLTNGTGVVTAEDVTRYSYLSTAAGAVSAPVNFHVYEDSLESAVITFKYDPSLLGDIDENALKIAWYDETNQEVIILEDSILNTEDNTISVTTDHFSQYIVIDTNEWYEKWAIEQLVIRDSEGTQTPYYNVIFALDGSGSMSGSREELCEEATMAFIKQLKGNDKISVMSFDDSATVYIENTSLNDITMTEIEEKVRQIGSSGGTNYEEGLNTALSLIVAGRENEDVEDTKSRQSLLIFLSDGEPTTDYSENTLEQLRYLAETAGCKAVSIGLGSGVNETYLREIAEAGQGAYFYVSDPSQLVEVFNTINGWYVGSTLDTDGDGLPDIVETTGMRTQFGEFIRTDPQNSDTDGDGISDGEEIGTFVYRDKGKSEFKISSNPTIPTYLSSESKVVVEKIALQTVKPSYDKLKSMNFIELYDMYQNYQATFCARAELLEVAADYLSEIRYQDAQPSVDFKFNTPCVDPKEVSKDFDTISAGSRFSCKAETICKNNILECEEDHNQIIFSVNNINGSVDTSKAKKERLNAKESWEKLLEEKKMLLQSEFNIAQTQMTEKTSAFLDTVQNIKIKAENQTLNTVQEKVETNLGIPANVPSDLRIGFLNCFNNYIKNNLITHIDSYKNVKTSADLVNKIYKEIETSDDTLKFTTPKGVQCTFTYEKIGVWGASYFSGTLKNNSTNATYTIGGTHIENDKIETEMAYLKEFADLKIEEAKSAIISDSIGLLNIDKLTDFLKDVIKAKTFEILDEVSPLISQKAEKLYNEAEKFKEVIKAYEDIADVDFTDTDYDELTEKLFDYTDSLNNWYKVVSNF